jgi:hypothetical protein
MELLQLVDVRVEARRLAPFVKRWQLSSYCWHMLVFLWSRHRLMA